MCFSGKRVRLKNQFGIKQIPLIREHVMIIWDLHLKCYVIPVKYQTKLWRL